MATVAQTVHQSVTLVAKLGIYTRSSLRYEVYSRQNAPGGLMNRNIFFLKKYQLENILFNKFNKVYFKSF